MTSVPVVGEVFVATSAAPDDYAVAIIPTYVTEGFRSRVDPGRILTGDQLDPTSPVPAEGFYVEFHFAADDERRGHYRGFILNDGRFAQ